MRLFAARIRSQLILSIGDHGSSVPSRRTRERLANFETSNVSRSPFFDIVDSSNRISVGLQSSGRLRTYPG